MKAKRVPYGRITSIIAQNLDDARGFIAELDNGLVRIGYSGVCSVDSGHDAFRALARRADGLAGDALDDAIAEVLRDQHNARTPTSERTPPWAGRS